MCTQATALVKRLAVTVTLTRPSTAHEPDGSVNDFAGCCPRADRPDIERFKKDDALEAYRRPEAGELTGRAVATPHG